MSTAADCQCTLCWQTQIVLPKKNLLQAEFTTLIPSYLLPASVLSQIPTSLSPLPTWGLAVCTSLWCIQLFFISKSRLGLQIQTGSFLSASLGGFTVLPEEPGLGQHVKECSKSLPSGPSSPSPSRFAMSAGHGLVGESLQCHSWKARDTNWRCDDAQDTSSLCKISTPISSVTSSLRGHSSHCCHFAQRNLCPCAQPALGCGGLWQQYSLTHDYFCHEISKITEISYQCWICSAINSDIFTYIWVGFDKCSHSPQKLGVVKAKNKLCWCANSFAGKSQLTM